MVNYDNTDKRGIWAWGGNLLKKEKGTLAVEFSILVPLIIFMAAGVLSMMLLGWGKMITSDAAREAARYEALNLPYLKQNLVLLIKT